ncbi:Uncharacterised protein [Amycolatopsis camponoti]|uniref:Uncharacterized protein n=1 Tax=Amycolatopsis camponoti TaxID=2606593 RepID=A0A6I8M4Y1_9PSEU|nr:Uncharacterised protein [Amycolatopsis camponoti]
MIAGAAGSPSVARVWPSHRKVSPMYSKTGMIVGPCSKAGHSRGQPLSRAADEPGAAAPRGVPFDAERVEAELPGCYAPSSGATEDVGGTRLFAVSQALPVSLRDLPGLTLWTRYWPALVEVLDSPPSASAVGSFSGDLVLSVTVGGLPYSNTKRPNLILM